jgi:hypothetical protein
MKVHIIGSIKRENGKWYAGYTESRSLIEFRLMTDTSPKIVGDMNYAVEARHWVVLNVNDVAEFHGVKK